MPFRCVTILGPGLLGGSLGLALKTLPSPPRVQFWGRSTESLLLAKERGAGDTFTSDLREAVTGSDLVVLCTPVGVMLRLAPKLAPLLAPGTTVTDVGSVKESLVRTLPGLLGANARFVGSHPMAGSEQAGIDAARPDLYRGAVCMVTPDLSTDPGALDSVRRFWADLGCAVRELSPAAHDQMVASVSHLPHTVAAALVNLVCRPGQVAVKLCGNGFRDTTRIASGPAGMWAEILMENRHHVGTAISGMIEQLGEFAGALERQDQEGLLALLERARGSRESLKEASKDAQSDE